MDGMFVNEYLVRMGIAEAVSYYPDTACNLTFTEAQDEAISGSLGMWAAAIIDLGERGNSIDPFGTPASNSSCNCYIDYNCSDFLTHSAAYHCFTSCGGSSSYNWSGLDGDHDGNPCESLP